MDILNNYYNNREDYIAMYLNDLEKAREKGIKGKGLKILTPNQMLKRLPIALAQIKVGNNSNSLLNEIRQIAYLCIDQKKLLKKYTTT